MTYFKWAVPRRWAMQKIWSTAVIASLIFIYWTWIFFMFWLITFKVNFRIMPVTPIIRNVSSSNQLSVKPSIKRSKQLHTTTWWRSICTRVPQTLALCISMMTCKLILKFHRRFLEIMVLEELSGIPMYGALPLVRILRILSSICSGKCWYQKSVDHMWKFFTWGQLHMLIFMGISWAIFW